MRRRLVLLSLMSLALVGVGCYFIWPPLALVVPGCLMWVDLFTAGLLNVNAGGTARDGQSGNQVRG